MQHTKSEAEDLAVGTGKKDCIVKNSEKNVDVPFFKAREAVGLAAAEAQKAGEVVGQGVNKATSVVDNTKNTLNNTVHQANVVAANTKHMAANIADASQQVSLHQFLFHRDPLLIIHAHILGGSQRC